SQTYHLVLLFSCTSAVFTYSTLSPFIIPPPPRSTLFPYTTLFRSKNKANKQHLELRNCSDHVGIDFDQINTFADQGYINSKICLDRKSTRLNCSHVKISYAVFCLKKKNKIISIRISEV